MHVVILAEFAVASGGAEKVAVESARGLAEAGADITYIRAVDGATDPLLDHPRIRLVSLGLSDIWTLPAWQAASTGIWHRKAADRLREALDALPKAPDVIHLHQWTRALSPSIMPVLFARDVPIVLTLHDYFLACPNGLYFRFDQIEPCALKPYSGACLAAACDPKSRLHKLVRVARGVAMRAAIGTKPLDVIHVSDASLARMAPMLGAYRLRHHRVDNPVRVAKSAPVEPARGDSVVYVGRLTREKGADLVAEAAALAGMPALFIGSGPLEAELSGRAGVEMLGWRSPAEVESVLRARARLVCAPSRWFETGPLTIYEALAQGIPVIASTRSGASEKVADGIDGYRVEPDVAPMAEAMARLKNDALVRRMGRAAHERYWTAPQTLNAHAAALLGIYRRMASIAESEPAESRAALADAVVSTR